MTIRAVLRRTTAYLIIFPAMAMLVTAATFLVTEPVTTISGFPVPYATFYPCCSSFGDAATGYVVYHDNNYVFDWLNFAIDIGAWSVILTAVFAAFTKSRLFTRAVVAGAIGASATFASLLLPPLAISAWATPESTQIPLGFPYSYAVHYTSYFFGIGVTGSSSGYVFSLSAAVADLALWTMISYVAVGAVLKLAAWIRAGGFEAHPSIRTPVTGSLARRRNESYR